MQLVADRGQGGPPPRLRAERGHQQPVVGAVLRQLGARLTSGRRHQRGDRVLPLPARGVPGERVADRGGQLPGVRGRAGLLTPGHFGGQVVGGAHHHAGGGQAGVALGPGDAEVEQVGVALLVHHDVGRLHVAVQHALGVRGGQRVGHGRPQPGGVHVGQRAGLAHHLGQGAALDVLHDDGQAVVVLHDVVHPHAVGVPDHGQRPGLAQHPLLGLLVGSVRELHRDRAVQLGVPGQPHRAEPTPAELANPLEPALAGQSTGRLGALGGATRAARGVPGRARGGRTGQRAQAERQRSWRVRQVALPGGRATGHGLLVGQQGPGVLAADRRRLVGRRLVRRDVLRRLVGRRVLLLLGHLPALLLFPLGREAALLFPLGGEAALLFTALFLAFGGAALLVALGGFQGTPLLFGGERLGGLPLLLGRVGAGAVERCRAHPEQPDHQRADHGRGQHAQQQVAEQGGRQADEAHRQEHHERGPEHPAGPVRPGAEGRAGLHHLEQQAQQAQHQGDSGGEHRQPAEARRGTGRQLRRGWRVHEVVGLLDDPAGRPEQRPALRAKSGATVAAGAERGPDALEQPPGQGEPGAQAEHHEDQAGAEPVVVAADPAHHQRGERAEHRDQADDRACRGGRPRPVSRAQGDPEEAVQRRQQGTCQPLEVHNHSSQIGLVQPMSPPRIPVAVFRRTSRVPPKPGESTPPADSVLPVTAAAASPGSVDRGGLPEGRSSPRRGCVNGL